MILNNETFSQVRELVRPLIENLTSVSYAGGHYDGSAWFRCVSGERRGALILVSPEFNVVEVKPVTKSVCVQNRERIFSCQLVLRPDGRKVKDICREIVE